MSAFSAQYVSFYMAASGLLFELTNVFYIPQVLMVQLRYQSPFATAISLLLVATFTVGRVVCCTYLAVLSIGT